MILLSSWNYRYGPPHPALFIFLDKENKYLPERVCYED
jgi:hypothetical protein